MKALSLWQPWATLCAIGAKEYETRSWGTPYRGPLAIHASKTEQGMRSFYQQPIRSALMDRGYSSQYVLPLGCVLCVCDLVDCIKMDANLIDSITEQEFAFGDWQEGRFAWTLANVRAFPNPLPMKGMQGLFECAIPQVTP